MTLARAFVFFGSLLVLALFAALIGPLFIDWTSYRADFEREASRILGQPVTVRGSADARLLPFPSVTFNDVIVGEAEPGAQDGADAMMRVARFSMDVELAPFLSGEILIFDMRLEEPEVRVELAEDGTLDWAVRNDGNLADSGIVLENVAVSDGTITIVDEQNGRSHSVEDFDAVISAERLTGPWRVQGTGAINGERGAFSVATGEVLEDRTLRVRTRLLPDGHPLSLELEGSMSVEDRKPRYEGTFTVQALDLGGETVAAAAPPPEAPGVALRGTGLFEATNERLRVSEYRLEVGAREDPYIVTGEATIDTGEAPEFLLIADGQQIDVDRLQGEDDAEAAGSEAPVSVAERIATFRDIVERIPIPDLPGRVSVVLPAVIAGETTLRDVSIDARPDGDRWLVDRFVAALPGRTQLEASGRLELGEDFGFSGELVLASNQPSGFAAWLTDDVDPAIRALSEAGFSADVNLSAGLQRFENLEMAVGSATLTGRFERQAGVEQRPVLSVDVSGDRIDIGAVNALIELFTDSGEGNQLARHDIAARLRADEFIVADIEMVDIETILTMRDGLLDVERLTVGEIAGAAVTGRGAFAGLPDAPEGAASLTLEAPRAEELIALADRYGGDLVDLSVLRDNAALFGETTLALELRLGSIQADGEGGGFEAELTGTTGGSRVAFSLASDNPIENLLEDDVRAELTLDNPRADLLLAQLGLPVLPIPSDEAARLSATLDGRAAENANFDLTLRSGDTRFGLAGSGGFAVDGLVSGALDLSLVSGDLEPFLLMNGIALPGFGTGLPADLSATVEVGAASYGVPEIAGQLGGNGVDGSLSITRQGRPEVSGRLALDTVDAGWLAEAVYGRPMQAIDGVGWDEGEFAATTDQGFSADILLDAGTAYLGYREAAKGLTARLAYDGSEVRVTDARAEWLGGALSGNLMLGNVEGSGVASMQMQLDGADIARMLAAPDREAPASGTADLSLGLEGSGKSAAGLVRSLTGSGALNATDVKIGDLDEKALAGILRAADAEGFENTPEAVARLAEAEIADGQFTIDSAAIPFTVAGGVVRFSNVVLENADASLTADGALTIADAILEARIDIAFEAGDETLAGATPAVSMVFAGPVDEPTRTLDATEMANFLSLRAYERERRRVETVQAAVLEKQRLRREVAYIRAQMREREEARLEAEAAAEAARLEREAMRLEQEAERREAAARAAAEAEAAAEVEAREAARREAEAEAEAARRAAEAARRAAEEADGDTEPAGDGDGPSGDNVERGISLPPPAEPESPEAAPETPSETPPTLDFESLPGVEILP